MTREILITGADSTVEIVEDGDGEPIRVKFGPEPYGLTLVGDLSTIHRLIIEADRQLSRLRVRPTTSPG